MPNHDLKDKILHNIAQQQVTPRPRWQFVVLNVLWWGSAILALLLAATAVAVTVYHVILLQPGFFLGTPAADVWFLLGIIPLFWLALLTVFIIIALLNIRHTRRGYRYSRVRLVLYGVGLSILCGVGFFAIGLGKHIDATLTDTVPAYSDVLVPRSNVLTKPDRGRLAGIVLEGVEQQHFEIRDIHHHEWTIVPTGSFTDPDAIMPGEFVLLRGEQVDNDTFRASAVKIEAPDMHPFPAHRFEEFSMSIH